MYAMYPDWGPAHHRHEDDAQYDAQYEAKYDPQYDAVQLGLDLRDNGGQRPDDN